MDAGHDSIPLFNETRWGSAYKLLQRAIFLKNCVTVWGAENGVVIEEPEWAELEDLHRLLKPFADLNIFLQGEEYPTMWMAIPTFNILFDTLDDLMSKYPNSKSLTSGFNKLKKYYKLTNSCPANFIATILCTKYKMNYFIKMDLNTN